MKRKFFNITIFILMLRISALSQSSSETIGESTGITPVEMIIIFVLSISIIVLLILIFMASSLYSLMAAMKKDGTITSAKPLFDFTQSVPIEKEHEITFHHDYDGIKELNNKMPPWWVYMFYVTIIWGVVYLWYYHVYGTGNVQEEEYITEMRRAEIETKKATGKINEENVTLLKDPARIENGKVIYIKNCAACHGKLGEGGVGPNLTDDYWLYGGNIKNIFKSIKYGIPQKGMIPWQTQLAPAQIQEVASYVKMLKGTNPPNAKAPQGELNNE